MRIEANGHEAEVRVEGEGPALTLIHGMASNLQGWDEVAARLSKRFKVIRYDLRGHGRSQKTAGPYTIKRFADDVQAILQNLEVAKIHIAGLSLGGLTVQCFALNHTHMVDKLIIIAAVANRSPEVFARLKERADKIDREGLPNVIDAALERWFTPEFRAARPDLVAKRVALCQQTDPKVVSATCRTFVEAGLAPELHRIKAPSCGTVWCWKQVTSWPGKSLSFWTECGRCRQIVR